MEKTRPKPFNPCLDFRPGDRVKINTLIATDMVYNGILATFREYTPTHHYARVDVDPGQAWEGDLVVHPESLILLAAPMAPGSVEVKRDPHW